MKGLKEGREEKGKGEKGMMGKSREGTGKFERTTKWNGMMGKMKGRVEQVGYEEQVEQVGQVDRWNREWRAGKG